MARQVTLSQEPLFLGRPYSAVPAIRRILNPDPGLSRAMLVLVFLRYVEDNAALLGVDFVETERLEAVTQAYGSAFFPAQNLPRHVGMVAGRLGMDADAFQSYASGAGEKHYKEVIPLFDLKPGTLARNECSRELMERLTGRVIPQPVGRRAFRGDALQLAGSIAAREVLAAERGKTCAICDLRCGTGSMLLMALGQAPANTTGGSARLSDASTSRRGSVGKKRAARMPDVWALDPDPDMVATTSMELLFSEKVTDFSHVRCAECLDTDILDDTRFDVIVGAFDPRTTLPDGMIIDPPAYDLESATIMLAADLLGDGGSGVFLTGTTLLSGRSSTEMRALLLDENLVDGAIELAEDAMRYSGIGAVLHLCANREEGDPVGLLHLSYERFGRITNLSPTSGQRQAQRGARSTQSRAGDSPSESKGTRPRRSTRESAIEEAQRVLFSGRKLPYVFERIPVEEIRSTPDLSLRYSTYRDTVDVLGELEFAEDINVLAQSREEILTRLRKLELEFHAGE